MSVSFSCEKGAHTKCIRPSCDCFCDHPHRAALKARTGELLARPAPAGARPTATFPVSRPSPRVTKPEREPRPRPPAPMRQPLQIDVDDLVNRYQAGATLRDLATHYHCSHEAIRSRLTAAGMVLRRGRGVPIDLPVDDLVAAYEAGATAKALAERYDTSANTILCRLRAAGTTIRAQGDCSIALPDADIADAYQAGATLEALAVRHNVSASTIANHLRACDIEIRKGGRLAIDTDELWRLYQTGQSTEHLALRFRVSPLTIKRRLVEAGHQLRPVGAKPNGMPPRVDLPTREIVLRYRLGWSLADLGDAYGVAWNTIRARLVAAGEPIRPMGRAARRSA